MHGMMNLVLDRHGNLLRQQNSNPTLAYKPSGVEWLGRLHGWSSRRLLW